MISARKVYRAGYFFDRLLYRISEWFDKQKPYRRNSQLDKLLYRIFERFDKLELTGDLGGSIRKGDRLVRLNRKMVTDRISESLKYTVICHRGSALESKSILGGGDRYDRLSRNSICAWMCAPAMCVCAPLRVCVCVCAPTCVRVPLGMCACIYTVPLRDNLSHLSFPLIPSLISGT